MTEGGFEKERRDWWKTVYLEMLVKVEEPKKAADKALRIFDKRFREEREKYAQLTKYRESELEEFINNKGDK